MKVKALMKRSLKKENLDKRIKLSDSDRKEILKNKKLSTTALANMYEVSRGCIWKIQNPERVKEQSRKQTKLNLEKYHSDPLFNLKWKFKKQEYYKSKIKRLNKIYG